MTRARLSRVGPIAAGLAIAVLVLNGAWSTRAAGAQPIGFDVRIILASNEAGGGIDPGLGPLAQSLRRTLGYTSYRLLSAQSGQLAPHPIWRTEVPGGRSLEISALGAQGSTTTLLVRMTAGESLLVNATVHLTRGGAPVLVGGPSLQSGVLIIAISTR